VTVRQPMSEERWARVEALFEGALDRPGGERAVWLAEECGGDEALCQEVKSLLEASASGLTDRISAVGRVAEELMAATGSTAVGERLGAYRLEAEIGRGGMGVVYRGARDDGAFEQTVAVKVLPGAMFSPERRARFANERRILAGLEHLNIARLLDGGTTPEGVPYVIMEYVDGVPLDAHVRERGLALEERIWLFLQVCHAVGYAHRQLVVHRDLKPSNILVTEDGVPKLLDFGIAKLTGVEGEGGTATHTRLMTPRYASPEQLLGQPLGTPTDVYSLGLVLYELLAGGHPRASTRGRGGGDGDGEGSADEPSEPTALIRAVLEGEPAAPSAASGDRRLRGDLDTIVLKALRREPDERYDSVRAFADDLERYLTGRPIAARPPSFAYRARKFVARNRGAVAVVATALGLLLLQGGLFTSRLAEERDAAEREAEQAALTLEFLTDLFGGADPFVSASPDMSAMDLLAQGTARLEDDPELADQPEVRAEILTAVGNVYENLGALDSARVLFQRSLAVREAAFGPSSLEAARGLSELGGLLTRMDEFDDARPLLRRALEIRRAGLAPNHPDVAVDLEQLASLEERVGDYELADSLFRAALTVFEAPVEPRDALEATIRSNYGLLLLTLDRTEEAETAFREALAMRRELYGDRHPEVAVVTGHLAALYERIGRYATADSTYRALLDWGPEVLGEESDWITTWLNNHAVVLKVLGRTQEALEVQEEVLRRRRAEGNGESSDVAQALNNLANLYTDAGRLSEAETTLREALEINRSNFGADHPWVATNLNNLASLAWRRGEFQSAAELQQQVLEMDLRQLGEDHEYVAGDLTALGTYLLYGGDLTAAEAPLREGMEKMLEVRGEDHLETANSMTAYADWLIAAGRGSEAAGLARRALETRRAVLDDDHIAVAHARSALGAALALVGETAEARRLLEEAADVMARTLPPEDPARVRTLARLEAVETHGSD
jgi:serine/threonine protein kinase/Tfp pilus assembly protein PilF